MWQQDSYGASSSNGQPAYYTPQGAGVEPLQFYGGAVGGDPNAYGYPGSRPSLDGNMAPQGSMAYSVSGAFGGSIQSQGGWWTAFGTGGLEGEPPLLQELGINFSHIHAKTWMVLNPVRQVDSGIMDDGDLAGPIIFFFCFGVSLLFSGKPNFGYIYGVGLFGCLSIYALLNLMSERGIDAYRTASVLGYCLLPMVGVSAINIVVNLEATLGYLVTILSILWCTYAASGIFVAVLHMTEQRLLVAYPVGLLYGCFALLTVFSGKTGVPPVKHCICVYYQDWHRTRRPKLASEAGLLPAVSQAVSHTAAIPPNIDGSSTAHGNRDSTMSTGIVGSNYSSPRNTLTSSTGTVVAINSDMPLPAPPLPPSQLAAAAGQTGFTSTGLAFDEEAKLVYGVVISLRNMVKKLSGRDEQFTSYRTSAYRLHLFETLSGYKFVMLTDPKTEGIRLYLRRIYEGPFLEYVVRNPLVKMDSREQGIDNDIFRAALDRMVRGLPMFA